MENQPINQAIMKSILIFLLSSVVLVADAQTQFIKSGRIIYERKVNQHKPLEERAENNSWLQTIMKAYPKFISDMYELKFNDSRSVYKLVKENSDNKYVTNIIKPTETDAVVQDIKGKTVSTQRDVFENTYLIKDTFERPGMAHYRRNARDCGFRVQEGGYKNLRLGICGGLLHRPDCREQRTGRIWRPPGDDTGIGGSAPVYYLVRYQAGTGRTNSRTVGPRTKRQKSKLVTAIWRVGKEL